VKVIFPKIPIGWFAIHAVDHCNQNCQFCNNHAPFKKQREYKAEEYTPHIDKMMEQNYQFAEIRISGGEPFLHSDIVGFAKEIKERYKKKMAIASNLFWLNEPNDIDRYEDLFRLIDTFYPSYYPHNQPQLKILSGAIEKLERTYKVGVAIRKKHWFSKMKFRTEPQKPTSFCLDNGDCTNLLADGRLARCAVGAYCEDNPYVTKEFLDSRTDFFFDLYKDEDILAWLQHWPHQACSYCTLWETRPSKWKNQSEILFKSHLC
jgi:hypothetical protein